ncbi:MAG TPA: phospho-sugar mutase [Candidatus Avidehalobacter gallistercoris]|uniref:Phosphoglucomutase n=1 Tax=Candidatus Avidehalobacter gallistercoris TaxID=2840694 RepID=A0A9D1HKP4_9FIRM|nr:phospho-sugar mutase [Candidatus Avidehalobacter gallistercoris]
MLSREAAKRYQEWLEAPFLKEADRAELKNLTDEKEITDRFYCDLEFGTGGMRGELGIGTNRMNIYLIRRLTQALADTVIEHGGAARGVAISYDSRRFSREFASAAAGVLAANGVKAYLFSELAPTPVLSFAVRYTQAMAGIMVTASHNPKQYNGYKVYWEDGGQLPPEQADKIIAKMAERNSWEVAEMPLDEAKKRDLLEMLGGTLHDAYTAKVKEQLLNVELCAAKGGELNIVYTPLSGTGRRPVERILMEIGFKNLYTVAAQAEPDEEFATVTVPNPEDAGAWALSEQLAADIEQNTGQPVDLLLATDPDADRLGVCCRQPEGGYLRLSGNQVGVLLAYYIIKRESELGILPENALVLKSVVSTALANRVVQSLGVAIKDVPVGFKYIGEQIKLLEDDGREQDFLFGFEESLGYLKGTYARDKDAVIAAALVAEAALYYRAQGQTLLDVLRGLYQEFGYYLDAQVARSFPGIDGREQMREILQRLTADRRDTLGGLNVASREYYARGEQLINGKVKPLDFPQVDMLGLTFAAGGGFIKVRSSGTEPKLRFYFCVSGVDEEAASANLQAVQKEFFQPVSEFIKL